MLDKRGASRQAGRRGRTGRRAGRRDHISTIRRIWQTIWSKWLPDSGHEAADAPTFERYGEAFDPQTGLGGFEIWVPLKA